MLTGGRLTLEDAYAYAKFARVALDTNDIDMRARPHSAEEEQFLAACVAGRGIDVSYADLEQAPAVLLAGFEPEDESPDRLPAAAQGGPRAAACRCSRSPRWPAHGLVKLSGTLLRHRARRRGGRADRAGRPVAVGCRTRAAEALRRRGAVILVGERLAEVPGALTARGAARGRAGAQLAWIPRRAGERGAIEAGALPGLLPGGRPVADPAAPRRGGQGLGQGLAARPARPRRQRDPGRGRGRRARRAAGRRASTRPTCPTRTPRWPRWTTPRSWSAWSCGPARSPTAPTWSSRSPPWPRRPARS